jgi:hypothetical protein
LAAVAAAAVDVETMFTAAAVALITLENPRPQQINMQLLLTSFSKPAPC